MGDMFGVVWQTVTHALERDITNDERIKFIAAFLEGNENFTELCERFGINKQGYKWRERYESGGLDGMKDRSRAPHHHPGAVVEPIADLIVQARRKHPSWGPRKLLVVLARHYPTLEFPVASTVGRFATDDSSVRSFAWTKRSDDSTGAVYREAEGASFNLTPSGSKGADPLKVSPMSPV